MKNDDKAMYLVMALVIMLAVFLICWKFSHIF